MAKYLVMIWGQFKYGFLMQKRYFFNLIASLFNTFLFLVFIQWGIHAFQGDISLKILSTKLAYLIIGFFIFTIISTCIETVSTNITEGATSGTLEQTMLSPFGAVIIFLSQAFVESAFGLIISLVIIPISMFVCRHWFWIDFSKLILFLPPLWLASWGLGFIISTFTLIYKRTKSFLYLIQFLILSLIVIPSYPFNLISLLPIAPEAMTFTRALASGESPPIGWILYLYLHSFLWLFIGMVIFRIGEKYSRKKGLLGQY